MADNAADLLDPRAIRLQERAGDKVEAIRMCGQALVEVGAVEAGYVDSMLDRESSVSTYVGEEVAIPHGTHAGKEAVNWDALSFLRFPDGIDWDGSTVRLCIGIAARGDGHLDVLAELAEILLDPDRARALREVTDADEVLRLLRPSPAEATT